MRGTPHDNHDIRSAESITNILADLPSFQFFSNISQLFVNPENAFERGAFQRIKAEKIDLPQGRLAIDRQRSLLWINRLPPQLQRAFTTCARENFILPLKHYVRVGIRQGTLPQPKVHATGKEYVMLLDKAEQAGMIHWNIVKDEDQEYTELTQYIQMTLFAVSKSESRSRLISWPRVQNEAFPDPPYTELPDPSLFQAVSVNGSNPSSYFLDVSNMFHNISLPIWLAKLFPLKPVRIASLSSQTRQRIAARLNINHCNEHDLIRPCQASIPMGFKWSVYVGHTFASSCLHQAFRIFKTSRLAPPKLAELMSFKRSSAPFIVTKETPLLMHIIDDVSTLTVDWTPQAVKFWYRIARVVLGADGLPTSIDKSCPFDQVETNAIPFIGCTLDLRNITVYPSPHKLQKVTQLVAVLLSSENTTYYEWQRMLGKLIWFAMLNRPLLACTQRVFQHRPAAQPQETFEISHESKRELRMLVALLPLARVEVTLPIVAFDASQTSGAVVWTIVPQQLASELWTQTQHERHNPPVPPRSNSKAVQAAVDNFKWKHAITQHWLKVEHINQLEASASILALEWLIRAGAKRCNLVILTVSLVTLGALRKGRSSAPGILVRCRRFGALALAHRLQVCLAYVRSENNPADKYTRLFYKRSPDQESADGWNASQNL